MAIINGKIRIFDAEEYIVSNMSKGIGTDKEITNYEKVEADKKLISIGRHAQFYIFSKVPYAYSVWVGSIGTEPDVNWWESPISK